MSDNRAAQFRRRAQRLRDLAITIERTSAMSLERHAGDDTWRGRRPSLCRSLLHTNQAQLHGDIERLRWQAYQFERQASELDTRSASAPNRAS